MEDYDPPVGSQQENKLEKKNECPKGNKPVNPDILSANHTG